MNRCRRRCSFGVWVKRGQTTFRKHSENVVCPPFFPIGAIAGGIGGLAVGFKDWITSPIPSHTLEKQFDKVATASAQELGGMAFDAVTGFVTAYR